MRRAKIVERDRRLDDDSDTTTSSYRREFDARVVPLSEPSESEDDSESSWGDSD